MMACGFGFFQLQTLVEDSEAQLAESFAGLGVEGPNVEFDARKPTSAGFGHDGIDQGPGDALPAMVRMNGEMGDVAGAAGRAGPAFLVLAELGVEVAAGGAAHVCEEPKPSRVGEFFCECRRDFGCRRVGAELFGKGLSVDGLYVGVERDKGR
jgi:hypothetical protein